QGVRLKNHLNTGIRSGFVIHDTWRDHRAIEKERRRVSDVRRGDDVFKCRVPVMMLKGNTGQRSGRDFHRQPFLVLSDPEAFNVPHQWFRWRDDNKLHWLAHSLEHTCASKRSVL